MGDISEGIVEGFFCQYCCCVVDGDSPGYPRTCGECGAYEESGSMVWDGQPIAKKLLSTLREVLRDTDNPPGMYPGYTWKMKPAQFAKLEKRGLVEKYRPHNPVHDTRAVITNLGREVLGEEQQ